MKLSWKIYGFVYALIVLLETYIALHPDSNPNTYYKILISFDKRFLWQYILHYFSVLIEVFALAGLFLFVFKKNWLPNLFWKIFFFVRILGLFVGNYYEANITGTMFIANKLLTSVSILIGLIAIVPSYIGLFLYAFKRK